MSRKIERGNIQSMNSTSSVSWKGGRRTSTKSVVKTDKKTGEIYRETTSHSVNILGLLCLLLLISAIFSLVGPGSTKTFYGFLQMLQETPVIDLSWLDWEWLTIFEGDWGIFEFARGVFAFLGDTLNILGFLGTGIAQLITYLIYFLRWLFL